LKLFQEWEEEVIMENDGGDAFKYNIFDILRDICKCHNVPPPSATIKEFLKKNPIRILI
jgi:hypothetical protein